MPDTSDRTADQRLVFRPRRSHGALVLAGTALLLLVVIPAPLLTLGDAGGATAVVVVSVALAVPLLALAASMPSMRYELTQDTLSLRCGPLLHYRIPVAQITAVTRRDLSPSLWSSLRLPGVALYTVPYNDVGRVRMCATRAAQGILLVVTEGGKRYGLTPEDEGRFVDTLTARLQREQHD